MNVTRNVVMDLLPLYEAGEASEDSRALVEDFLRANPAFKAELDARVASADALLAGPIPAPAPDLERTTLERTRRYIRTRTIFLAIAIALWVVPFFPLYDGQGLWFMWTRNPFLAALCIVVSTLISTVQTIHDRRRRRAESRR